MILKLETHISDISTYIRSEFESKPGIVLTGEISVEISRLVATFHYLSTQIFSDEMPVVNGVFGYCDGPDESPSSHPKSYASVMVYFYAGGCLWLVGVISSAASDSGASVASELRHEMVRLIFNQDSHDHHTLLAIPSQQFPHFSTLVHSQPNYGEEGKATCPFSIVSDIDLLRDLFRDRALDAETRPRLRPVASSDQLISFNNTATNEDRSSFGSASESSDTGATFCVVDRRSDESTYESIDSHLCYFKFLQLCVGDEGGKTVSIRYPPGFHPNNHWKKNKKTMYLPRQRDSAERGYRGGRGGGRGGRYHHRNRRGGGHHGSYDGSSSSRQPIESSPRNGMVALAGVGLVTALLFAFTLFKHAPTVSRK